MRRSMNRRDLLKSVAAVAGGLSVSGLKFSPFPTHDSRSNRTKEGVLKLNANENPYGPSDKARAALIEAISIGHQYPIPFVRQLEREIAHHEGVTTEHVLIGAG